MPATILCVKWGTKYSPDYVNRLASMTRRHLSLPHNFVCLTDDTRGVEDGIETIPIPETSLEFCWTKLLIFSPQMPEIGSPVLYLDLDVVITGSLDGLFTFSESTDFVGVPDWNRRWFPQFNSSVMRFTAGNHVRIYDDFVKAVGTGRLVKRREWDACLQSRNKVVYWENLRRYGGDQEWISRSAFRRGTIRDHAFPKSWVLSYKTHCRSGIPPDCRVVVFHGEPKPHEVSSSHIREHWH